VIDKVMDTMSNFMNKVSSWLTLPSIPWEKFSQDFNEFITMVAPWNRIFPITDILTVLGLIIAVSLALMTFFTVVLIKSFIPFSGGK
jgi:hypothetical protein